MTSRCAASFQKLKFNTKHTIYFTFLQRCSFKFVLLIIHIRGHAVTYRSAFGHTVSRDANSQARVHQVWTLERSAMRNFSHGLAFLVWRIRMRMNGSQWSEKCSVTAPLLGLGDISHAICMHISSVKLVSWLVVNLHHLFSNGATFNTRSRRSLTSDAITLS